MMPSPPERDYSSARNAVRSGRIWLRRGPIRSNRPPSGEKPSDERIGAEFEHGKAQSDLTIWDSEGRVRVFVENKFWAGLTGAQPVSYLDNLPEDPPFALMFIVSEQCLPTVWKELKARCIHAGHEWADAPGGRFAKCARVGSESILIAS